MKADISLDIFQFKDYRHFVNSWIRGQDKKGHGQLRKISLYLRIAPVTITQIFRGDRELPIEAAPQLAEFLHLSGIQKKFFVKLVMYSRAGNQELRDFIFDEMQELRKFSEDLKNRVPSDISLSEADLAVFHSSWLYSAVRLLTSIDDFSTATAISNKLKMPLQKIQHILDFLVSKGLCILKSGYYKMGPSRTHLPESSPFIIPRQISWREKGIEQMNHTTKSEIYYTAPMSLSKEDIPRIRREILLFIDHINKIVGPSKSEDVACLNIDWFKIT